MYLSYWSNNEIYAIKLRNDWLSEQVLLHITVIIVSSGCLAALKP